MNKLNYFSLLDSQRYTDDRAAVDEPRLAFDFAPYTRMIDQRLGKGIGRDFGPNDPHDKNKKFLQRLARLTNTGATICGKLKRREQKAIDKNRHERQTSKLSRGGLRAKLEAIVSFNGRPTVRLTQQEAMFLSRFDGIAGVTPEGRKAIEDLSSTGRSILNRLFRWTPDQNSLRDMLTVCANHGYLSVVAKMLQTRVGLADFMANWPSHIETLHILQQNSMLKDTATIQQGKGMPTREAVETLIDVCRVEGRIDPAILKAVVDKYHAKAIPSRPSLEKIRVGCLNRMHSQPIG